MTAIKDIHDLPNYVFIKVCLAIHSKFKPGDHIMLRQLDHNCTWKTVNDCVLVKQSPYYEVSSAYIDIPCIYRIDSNEPGSMKLSEFEYNAKKYFEGDVGVGVLSFDEILNIIYETEHKFKKNDSVDSLINFIADNIIVLDPDYADSVIMETEYTPYQLTSDDIKERIRKEEARLEKELKLYKSHIAQKAWNTRRENDLIRKNKAKIAAANAKRAATIAAKKKAGK